MRKIIALLLAALLLTACAPAQSAWPGYHPDRESYEYCHHQERDRLWEEDILFFADTFLGTHPTLKESETTVHTLIQLPASPEFQQRYDDSDAFFDAEARKHFIAQINALIPSIPELTDAQIVYEMQRIVASLGDSHSGVDMGFRDFFPIEFDVIYENGEPSFYAVRVLQGHEELLLGKLTAINGVATEEVISRLAPYIPHENPYWLVYRLSHLIMTQLTSLQQVGVVNAGENSAVFSLETDSGIMDVTLEALPSGEYSTAPWVSHPMLTAFAYSTREDLYWHELLNNGRSLYIRFSAMDEDPEYSLNSFLGDVKKIIRESKEPLQIILDFRGNSGGWVMAPETQSLVAGIIPYPAHSTYILIDSGSFSAGVGMPWRLSVAIPGAQLIGSPSGQGPNHFSNPVTATLPNHGYPILSATIHHRNTDGPSENAIQPDVTVYQTLEDYRECKDTVLEYVFSLTK